MNVARFALANDKLLVFLTIALTVLGVRAYVLVPASIFPTMSFSKIDVVVDAGNLPPSRVRGAIALPLGVAFESLPNATRVEGTSSQGSAEFLVDFDPSTDPRVNLEIVDRAIARLRPTLVGATDVTAVVVDPNSEPILSYALTSRSLSTAVLRDIATRSIAPKLFGIPGLGRVLVTGGAVPEVHADLDPSELAVRGIGPADVSRALADANAVLDVGAQQAYAERRAIVVDASLGSVASLAALGVPDKNGNVVPLGALGRIALGVAPPSALASYDGRAAVVINAYPLPGADTVRASAALRARFAAMRLPSPVRLDRFWDQTTLVVESQRSLRDAIVLGAILAIVVIYAFLRDGRLTLVAAAIIPVAMAIAVFALQLAGQTLNLMSVGGLAVAVGLIIDDAIVVIEGIARTSAAHPDLSTRDAIERTMGALARPMAASTATTLVVFLPLGLLTGVAGFFFRSLAFTLASSLVVSLALALFVAPIVARVLARPARAPHRPEPGGGLLVRYGALLTWVLRRRGLIYAGSVGVLVVTIALLATLPTDFLPRMDEGQFEVAYALPTGTTLAATDAASRAMERIVVADPAVASVGRLTGVDSNGYSPTPQNKGLLRVALRAPGTRDGYEAIAARLRDRLQDRVPSATFDFHQILEDLIDGLSGTPAPIEISLYGDDLATLDALAVGISHDLAKIPGIVDAASGAVYDSPTLRVRPRDERLAALGLTAADVGDAVAATTQGTIATSVAGSFAQIPVRVSVANAGGAELGSLADVTIYPKGVPLALSDVAMLDPPATVPEQNDEDGRRTVRVTANSTGANLSTVVARVREVLRARPLPPGYVATIGGQSAVAAASFREFATVVTIAIALVFCVMLATFRSYRVPLVILTAIPLALIGVAGALAITRTPFNVSSFMGLLLLVGIVVKNGILLVDVANARRAAGDDMERALVAAGNARLRPIVMTTLAAIGGLLPLAFGLGQGSEMEKPLAIAVIGGLSTATVFTLVVIPVLYATFAGGVRPTAV